MSSSSPSDSSTRVVVWSVVGGVVACALLMWLAHVVDTHQDRPRAMYDDVFRMADLQTAAMKRGGAVVPVDVSGGEEVQVGRRIFRPSPGVRIQVVARDGGYCVRGWNRHGDRTRWQCGDAEETP